MSHKRQGERVLVVCWLGISFSMRASFSMRSSFIPTQSVGTLSTRHWGSPDFLKMEMRPTF